MKKKQIMMVGIGLPVLLIAGLFFFNRTEVEPVQVNHPHADWTEYYENADELINESDLIVLGTVCGSTTEQRFDMIFTLQEIEIMHVLNGNLEKSKRLCKKSCVK